jgi:intracellular sulfur oxidation DsrE/DsrF family protein
MKGFYLLLFVLAGQVVVAQTNYTPIFKNNGKVFDVPTAVDVIDHKATYKILIDINTSPGLPADVNENIENIARIVNLHAAAGISRKKMKVIAVFHGAAVAGLVNNEVYKEKNKVDINPNLALLKALNEEGVELYVCGQTLARRNIDAKTISTDVVPVLSAITTISTYAAKGYTVFKY